jgi:hypothetical protein
LTVTLTDASGSYPLTLPELVAFVAWAQRYHAEPSPLPTFAEYLREVAS